MPESTGELEDYAMVVSVGPDVTAFKVGDKVLRPAPVEFEYEDETYGDTYLITAQANIPAKF